MVASRIAIYSEQRLKMDKSKKAMAAAIKAMGRNTGSLQEIVTGLRADDDKFTLRRRKKDKTLREMQLEFRCDKAFIDEDEDKLREEQEKVEDLEHSRYVTDIAMVETLGALPFPFRITSCHSCHSPRYALLCYLHVD